MYKYVQKGEGESVGESVGESAGESEGLLLKEVSFQVLFELRCNCSNAMCKVMKISQCQCDI